MIYVLILKFDHISKLREFANKKFFLYTNYELYMHTIAKTSNFMCEYHEND